MGCGNGRNLNINNQINILGCDKNKELCKLSIKKNNFIEKFIIYIYMFNKQYLIISITLMIIYLLLEYKYIEISSNKLVLLNAFVLLYIAYSKLEGFTTSFDNTSADIIKTLSSVYNDGTLRVNNIIVNNDLDVTGKTTLGKGLDVKGNFAGEGTSCIKAVGSISMANGTLSINRDDNYRALDIKSKGGFYLNDKRIYASTQADIEAAKKAAENAQTQADLAQGQANKALGIANAAIPNGQRIRIQGGGSGNTAAQLILNDNSVVLATTSTSYRNCDYPENTTFIINKC